MTKDRNISPQRSPYPNIDAPAWTVLLRTEPGQIVTAELAAELVGPDCASFAIAQLEEKHLLDESRFTPLAEALRRWNRQRQGQP